MNQACTYLSTALKFLNPLHNAQRSHKFKKRTGATFSHSVMLLFAFLKVEVIIFS